MRTFTMALGAVLSIAVGSAIAADTVSIDKMPYPGVLALSEDKPGQWLYKSFPNFLPLYVFDGEPEGKSTCDAVCSAVWPIIKAEENSKPMGHWTIIKRDDGRKQWAFKGKAAYMYFEDLPNEPHGAGKEQEWFMDEGGIAYLLKAGVQLPPDFKPVPRKNTDTKIVSKLLLP